MTSGEAGIGGPHPDECRRVREAEQVESARIVGVTEVTFLACPTASWSTACRCAASRGGGPPRATGDRGDRELPGDLGRPVPEPGRPHRGRQSGPGRGARRWQPVDLPRAAHRRTGAVGRCARGVGLRITRGHPRRGYHRHLRPGRCLTAGACGVHLRPGLGELGPTRVPRRLLPAVGRPLGSPSRRRSRCSRWHGVPDGARRDRDGEGQAGRPGIRSDDLDGGWCPELLGGNSPQHRRLALPPA